MGISLCDNCSLREICSIKVLEKDVGKPYGDLGSMTRKRVLKCGYFEKTLNIGLERYRIFRDVVQYLEKNFEHIEWESYIPKIERMIRRIK